MKKFIILILFLLPCFSYGNISLEAKIGQMLIVGFEGIDVSESDFILEGIKNHNLGGVTIEYNIKNPQQLKSLIDKLQHHAKTPLFIAIDHEGGNVCRLTEEKGFPPTVSAKTMGNHSSSYTLSQGTAMAKTLKSLGINLNFAPVVDIHAEGNFIAKKERCFSNDLNSIIEHAEAFINSHNNENIYSTLKHFPGHGSSTSDSHYGIADVSKTWTDKELTPYQYFIKENKVDCIMISHVFLKSLDPDFPASMSHKIITGQLRNKLGYQGVVISDDIQMGALYNQYNLENILIHTINAGVDIILINNTQTYEEDIIPRAISIVKNAIKEGVIAEETINQAYSRISKLKEKFLL